MGGALNLQFNMILTPKSTIYTISVLVLSSFVSGLSANTEPVVSDTNNSAVDSVILEQQTGILSTDETAHMQAPLIESAPIPGTGKDSDQPANLNLSGDIKILAQPNKLPQSVPVNLRRILPITLESAINSKSVKVGDKITAKLKENLYYGRQLIAPANSIVEGRVFFLRNSRTLSQATFKVEDRFKSNASLELVFDNIRANENYSIPITARPVHQQSTRTTADGLVYGIAVDHNGRVTQGGRTLTNNQKNVYNTLRVATVAPLPGGLILNLGGTPVIMAAVGAISPDIVFNKPIDKTVSHRRLKGMGYGFVTSLPGAFFVQSVVEKGNEIILSKGDELMIDITISNQLIQQTPSKPPPEALVVKAKLLEEEILPQKHSDLPLKPSIESNSSDEYSTTKEKTGANQAVVSGLESQISD